MRIILSMIGACLIIVALVMWAFHGTVLVEAQNVNTTIDRSGSITTGGTSQQLMAQNTTFSRKYLLIINPCNATDQNIATAENLYINFTSAAAVGSTSIPLVPCGSFSMAAPGPVSSEQINVIAATTSHKYVAKEIQ